MNLQWYPGHMAKTRRLISENLKLVDVVLELLDARIPKSSKNPLIDDIVGTKPRIILLNKSDLADEKISRLWIDWYASKGYPCILVNSITGAGINSLKSNLMEIMKDKLEREKEKGRRFCPIKTMVVGIPNVGKSSFINKIAGRASAMTGDKPGVTRNKQWIRLDRQIYLLDTPGVLWPKFEDQETGLNLAFTGAIKDEVFDIVEAASFLMEKLSKRYPDELKSRFKLDSLAVGDKLELLEAAGRKRGCIISGGEVDYNRIAAIVLDEFRGGKIGRISLETPTDAVIARSDKND